MDNVSVSKGVFAYKGSYKIDGRKSKTHRDYVNNEPWFIAYKEAWSIIQNAAEEINSNMFKQILSELQDYVKDVKNTKQDDCSCEIPTAILLTGINLPDHGVLFDKLASELSTVSKQIAIIQSRDSVNIKNLIEETIYQLINGSQKNERQGLKKNQCTLRMLKAWHEKKCDPDTPLIIVIPDFESFYQSILRDFILILSSYRQTMKFVLVFGVATTLHAVHRSLSYDVTSKLRVQVFRTQKQLESLSNVLEGTVLSGKTPFMLTGRAFQLLTDIFLYYDFSVDGFLQGYKLCMNQHFLENNLTALCCSRIQAKKKINELSEDDIVELKKLSSIVNYMQKCKDKFTSEMNDQEFKKLVLKLVDEFHEAMSGFFPVLKCLHYLTSSLPGAPMGKQLREVYANAVTFDLIERQEYKDSLRLLSFLSKQELLMKLEKIIEILTNTHNLSLKDVVKKLKKHVNTIKNASLEVSSDTSEIVGLDKKLNRLQLKEKLLKMSQKQSRSPFKQASIELIEYMDRELFAIYLVNPNRLPASEIFCFSDANAGKHHLKGSLRSVLHTGLNDPQAYINCDCCKLDTDETIQPSFPDLNIIYKLHLESRKLINMYDWLQAFLTIVNPNDDAAEQREVDPKMQARFTQAVADLQFLGFIKTSQRKTDHVKRLT